MNLLISLDQNYQFAYKPAIWIHGEVQDLCKKETEMLLTRVKGTIIATATCALIRAVRC